MAKPALVNDMDWMKRLMQGRQPVPPSSMRPAGSWDELVQQARSPDGRQRQQAVRVLAASGYAPALAVMLERLNDWVGAIRRDAREGIENFLRGEFVEAWLASLDALAALTRARRADHTALLEHIVAWLLAPPQFTRVDACRNCLPREIARLMLQARMREPLDSPTRQQAWHDALGATDVVLAGNAAQALDDQLAMTRADDTPTRALLGSLARAAMASRYARIRIAGLRAALALPEVVPNELVRRLCFDTNANARALAIGTLRGDDAAMQTLVAQAMDALAPTHAPLMRATALASLCAMAGDLGLRRCEAFRHDPAPAVRATALRQLLPRADAVARDALVLAALADTSSHVRRIAVAQVQRGAGAPSADILLALASARPPALSSLCAVATRLPPWERLGFLMASIELPGSPPVSDLLVRELGRWSDDMRRTWVTPAAAQREQIRHAWAARRDQLPRALQGGIAYHLRSFGVLEA